MTANEIITDPTLLSALEAAELARQQCLEILDLLDSCDNAPTKEPTVVPPEVEEQVAVAERSISGELGVVRALHRSALQGVREEKAKTAEARHEVDRLHLQLQNLYYEQRHLAGEIQACESYELVHSLVVL